MGNEAQILMNRLAQRLASGVIDKLKDRFKRNGGIDSLWGQDGHPGEKWILFRRDSGFYSEGGMQFLASLVEHAKTDVTIHTNLLQFVLLLNHTLRYGLKVLAPSELQPLASDKEIIPLVWRGVISNRIQPRIIGSLKQARAQLATSLGNEELLPVPDWWDKGTAETTL
jgi:hypothetical protein